jgi:hypothetical protein
MVAARWLFDDIVFDFFEQNPLEINAFREVLMELVIENTNLNVDGNSDDAQPHGTHVTIKDNQNSLYLWAIALAFPDAKLVLVTRGNLDTALSVYAQGFAVDYANDLEAIAAVIDETEALMAHWHDLGIAYHTVSYEGILQDVEGTVRTLLTELGLDFHPNCLQFHRSERETLNPSLSQVRRPIYTTSREGWKQYPKQMERLKQRWRATD